MSDVTVTHTDYPLSTKRPDLLTTPRGLSFDDLTLDAVMAGTVQAEDLRSTPATLGMQADIAESVDRPALAANLRRAAELTAVPDERVLAIYNAMRPNASTKAELLAIADELESEFNATHTARLVREAADVYERRDVLGTGA